MTKKIFTSILFLLFPFFCFAKPDYKVIGNKLEYTVPEEIVTELSDEKLKAFLGE